MFRFAQTNIQLYKQMVSNGYLRGEICQVREAYELTVRLMVCRFRPTGKPAISHFVGVSSVLASIGAPIELVCCGLLHSSYLFGSFGEGCSKNGPENNRRLVRDLVGNEAELIVNEWSSFQWSTTDNLKYYINLPSEDWSNLVRNLSLVRISHEIEEHSDWAHVFCKKIGKEKILERLGYIKVLADKLGQSTLVEYVIDLDAEIRHLTVTDTRMQNNSTDYYIWPQCLTQEGYRGDFRAWRKRCENIIERICDSVPSDEKSILIDGAQLINDERLFNYELFPFLEKEGRFWGLPADSQSAIMELERLRKYEAKFLIVCELSYWWVDTYQEFFQYLNDKFTCILSDSTLIIFDLGLAKKDD